MANGAPEEVRRWTTKRRVALVLSILKGETSLPQAARKHGLTVADIEYWQERLLTAAENGPELLNGRCRCCISECWQRL